MSEIIKKTAQIANDLWDTAGWILKKLDAPGHKVVRDHARGQIAEITVPIKPGGTGEITVILSQSRQHFPAKSLRGDVSFKKGDRVRVSEIGSNIMFVEPIDDTTSGDLAPLQ